MGGYTARSSEIRQNPGWEAWTYKVMEKELAAGVVFDRQDESVYKETLKNSALHTKAHLTVE